MSEVQPAELSPDRLRQLPDSALLAFAARNALRVLPLFNPPPGQSQNSGDQIQAAIACCLAALRTAIDSGLHYGSATGRALNAISGSDAGTELSGAAATAVIAAGHSSVARQADDPEALRQWVLSGYAAASAAAEALGPRELFAASAADDVAVLESMSASPGTADESVRLSLFQRQLLRSDITPDKTPAVVGAWGKRLEALAMRDMRDLYVRIHDGQVSQSDLEAMDIWIHQYEDGFEIAARVPREAAATASAAAPSPVTSPPDVWMLADRPLDGTAIDEDRFGFKDYADALATIIDHPKTGTPFTMVINAPWGAGKTTLAKMIEHQLLARARDRGDAPHIICWFNAWMHDDAPDVATAFLSEVSRTADRYREPLTRVVRPIPAAVLTSGQRRWRRVRNTALGMAIIAMALVSLGGHLQHLENQKKYAADRLATYEETSTIIRDAGGTQTGRSEARTVVHATEKAPPPQSPGTPDRMDAALDWVQGKVVVLAAFLTAIAGLLGFLTRVLPSTSLSGFVQAPKDAAASGSIPYAQAQIGRLIKDATSRGNRFIVFIDDIERCKPPRSVDVLDAVIQLMDHPQVVVVLLGDMATVAAAVQLKYKDLADTLVPNASASAFGPARAKEAFAQLYLQKMVQFQFDLPIPPPSRIQAYMTDLAASGGTAPGVSDVTAAI